MDLVQQIKDAGIVGAGGAGFPTHVKVNSKAEVVIANGAECEPLLQVDQTVMTKHADDIVRALLAVMETTGAREGVICSKKHYHHAVAALEAAIKDKANIRIKLFDSFYPAGDEQTMVFEVTGKVVPTGGIPLDVGAVVLNVSTLNNITAAMEGTPVTEKWVTVAGEVENPVTVNVPVGTPYAELIRLAKGPRDMSGHTMVIGGPCMGKPTKDMDDVVTKMTGGIIVLEDNHLVVDQKRYDVQRDIKLAKAVCCQCCLCTQMCPRNALGLNVQPHKAMRAAANGNGKLLDETNGLFSCCDCGLCTTYACNFGLNPSGMMARFKDALRAEGVKPKKEIYTQPDSQYSLKKVPVSRLMGRMGIKEYDKPAPPMAEPFKPQRVRIPLTMHIGAPSEPMVTEGQTVENGQQIAGIPEGKLGAAIHASISGRIAAVTDTHIEIVRKEG